jgi:kynureninase
MLKASLDIFDQAGIDNLRKKSIKLTGYLEYTINHYANKSLQIITPKEVEQRGCQLSVKLVDANRELFDDLTRAGVVTDFREPNVIRIAPVPLYNSFQDIFYFGKILKENTHG